MAFRLQNLVWVALVVAGLASAAAAQLQMGVRWGNNTVIAGNDGASEQLFLPLQATGATVSGLLAYSNPGYALAFDVVHYIPEEDPEYYQGKVYLGLTGESSSVRILLEPPTLATLRWFPTEQKMTLTYGAYSWEAFESSRDYFSNQSNHFIGHTTDEPYGTGAADPFVAMTSSGLGVGEMFVQLPIDVAPTTQISSTQPSGEGPTEPEEPTETNPTTMPAESLSTLVEESVDGAAEVAFGNESGPGLLTGWVPADTFWHSTAATSPDDCMVKLQGIFAIFAGSEGEQESIYELSEYGVSFLNVMRGMLGYVDLINDNEEFASARLLIQTLATLSLVVFTFQTGWRLIWWGLGFRDPSSFDSPLPVPGGD